MPDPNTSDLFSAVTSDGNRADNKHETPADQGGKRAAHNVPLPTALQVPVRKQGRSPKLTLHEVTNIRSDPRSIRAIATAWGISQVLVMRVKQLGAWKDVRYIPRDEFDRSKHLERHYPRYREPTGKMAGRKPVSGREHLSAQERQHIVNSDERNVDLAKRYGVTAAYVSNLKHKHRRTKGVPKPDHITLTPELEMLLSQPLGPDE